MRTPPNPRLGTAASIGISLVVHALIYAAVMTYATVPELDFELTLPTEIEFGLTDEVQTAAGQAFGDTAQAEPEAAGDQSEDGAGKGLMDAGAPDSGAPPDAGVRDAGLDQGALLAEGSSSGEDDADAGVALPAGAQIAIRIDLSRVRSSALAENVRRLMEAIPDWQLLLEGSGLDPLNDLDRLLIASPNLQRSRMVLAGRHAHGEQGEDFIRAVVARFAAARGTEATWQRRHGVWTAPWPNEDETERVIAIVGARHFVIARPADLPTILAIAVARTQAGDQDLENPTSGADALLSMGEGEGFSVEVEGARNFVRGRVAHVPERLRVAITEGNDSVVVGGTARFEDASTAAAARDYWEEKRTAAQRNMFIGSYVRGMSLTAEDDHVRIEHQLTFSQMRMAMAFLEGTVARPRSRPRDPPSPATPMSASDRAEPSLAPP